VKKRTAVILALIAAVVALIAATQPWLHAKLDSSVSADTSLEVTGKEANEALIPLALAVLAASVALTIAARVFRIILGVIVTLLGAGLVWASVSHMVHPVQAASAELSTMTGLSGGSQFDLVQSHSSTVWPVIALIAAALAVFAGVVVLVWGNSWQAAGRKYETRIPSNEHDRVADWDMLSHGDDPSEDS
jgi:uncharacterized membrane protein (TIGR02234 family)